ncbi:hypothetical protein DMUE_2949, partial [Dictyocoela muelleri]
KKKKKKGKRKNKKKNDKTTKLITQPQITTKDTSKPEKSCDKDILHENPNESQSVLNKTNSEQPISIYNEKFIFPPNFEFENHKSNHISNKNQSLNQNSKDTTNLNKYYNLGKETLKLFYKHTNGSKRANTYQWSEIHNEYLQNGGKNLTLSSFKLYMGKTTKLYHTNDKTQTNTLSATPTPQDTTTIITIKENGVTNGLIETINANEHLKNDFNDQENDTDWSSTTDHPPQSSNNKAITFNKLTKHEISLNTPQITEGNKIIDDESLETENISKIKLPDLTMKIKNNNEKLKPRTKRFFKFRRELTPEEKISIKKEFENTLLKIKKTTNK